MKKLKLYLALHIFLMIYATSSIFSKLAAGKPFMSLPFIFLYGMQILLLAFYAIGWQQFIKRMPLSVAYANKAVSVIWGCVWGVLIFHEHLTAGKVIGGLLVLIGIAIYGYSEGAEEPDFIRGSEAPRLGNRATERLSQIQTCDREEQSESANQFTEQSNITNGENPDE